MKYNIIQLIIGVATVVLQLKGKINYLAAMGITVFTWVVIIFLMIGAQSCKTPTYKPGFESIYTKGDTVYYHYRFINVDSVIKIKKERK